MFFVGRSIEAFGAASNLPGRHHRERPNGSGQPRQRAPGLNFSFWRRVPASGHTYNTAVETNRKGEIITIRKQ